MNDLISRQKAIDAIEALGAHAEKYVMDEGIHGFQTGLAVAVWHLERLPSAETERYTKEELRVFQHGISLSLLSKRSAQHWQYDEDRATEIKFLERLYEKVGADMRGEQDE